MAERITINPITRLEGHGKIEIFLDDKGEVADAFWQVVELRGFERFCVGRPAEEMTRIAPNICGVCPSAHHMAATKALDDLYGVEPTPTAKLLRRLEYNAFVIEDHFIHFFFLAAPDFILGPDSDPARRNILGVVGKVGKELAGRLIDIRKRNRDIIRMLFTKPPHPEGGLPGGVPRGIDEEERKTVAETARASLEFAQDALGLFRQVVLENPQYRAMVESPDFQLKTGYMSLVDEAGQCAFYDGAVRVIDPEGNPVHSFAPKDYIDYIAEHVEPWTYVKMPFLKQAGWKGFVEGEGTSLYRVGPLARVNVPESMATPSAEEARQEMMEALGGSPVHNTLAMHWARLISALQAAEDNVTISQDPALTSKDIRNMNLSLRNRGVGCVEAPRGTLFHHYETDDQGILTKVNLVVATQHNAAPISMSIKKAAQGLIHGSEVKEGLLNQVEMAFRAYDPCLACATHALNGRMALTLDIRDQNGTVLKTVRNSEPPA